MDDGTSPWTIANGRLVRLPAPADGRIAAVDDQQAIAVAAPKHSRSPLPRSRRRH